MPCSWSLRGIFNIHVFENKEITFFRTPHEKQARKTRMKYPQFPFNRAFGAEHACGCLIHGDSVVKHAYKLIYYKRLAVLAKILLRLRGIQERDTNFVATKKRKIGSSEK